MRILIVVVALLFCALPVRAASLADMAGQMIMVGFQGQSADAPGVVAASEALARGEIGGVMFLKTNVASLARVKAMAARFGAANPELPALVALDQEGGQIERLTAAVGFTEIPSAADVARTQTPAVAQATYRALAGDLASLGFNLNFGPVADVNLNPANPIIARYGRAYGRSADVVTRYAGAFIEGHRDAGVLTALKHFPGHGSSTADSHAGFVDVSRTWQAVELTPFSTLIGRGLADLVMVAHLTHQQFGSADAPRLPSSLSPAWITGVLRTQLGFDGVVITDDLEMGAIRQAYGLRETVVRAVEAGVDMLLFSNTASYRTTLGAEVRAILVETAAADPAFARRIEESYRRIVALKARLVRPDDT